MIGRGESLELRQPIASPGVVTGALDVEQDGPPPEEAWDDAGPGAEEAGGPPLFGGAGGSVERPAVARDLEEDLPPVPSQESVREAFLGITNLNPNFFMLFGFSLPDPCLKRATFY